MYVRRLCDAFRIAVNVFGFAETAIERENSKQTSSVVYIGERVVMHYKAIQWCVSIVMPINWLGAYTNTYGDAGEIAIALITLNLRYTQCANCAQPAQWFDHKFFFPSDL